jgi:WD40 repeat protein
MQHVRSLAFLPKTTSLLSGTGEEIDLWNWESGVLLLRNPLRHSKLNCFALSPDGTVGLSGAFDHTLRLWNMKSYKPSADLPGHTTPIWCVAFSPDGKKALSASGQPKRGGGEYEDCTVRVWDVAGKKEVCRFSDHSSEVQFAAFQPNGRYILSANLAPAAKICIWDASTGKEIRRLARSINPVVVTATCSVDGRYLLIGWARDARLWDVEKDQEVHQLKGHAGIVNCVAFSRDGKYALTADTQNQNNQNVSTMRLWDVATGRELRRYPKHPGELQRLAFTPDGRHIVTGYDGGQILVWETGIRQPKS